MTGTIGDESVVAGFASSIGSTRRLKLLYLLAWADAGATGPKAWSDWTASLMAELYFKALEVLWAGDLSSARAARKMLKTRDSARALARKAVPPLDPGFVEACLENMPSRYTLTVEPPEIIRRLQLVKELQAALAEERLRLSVERAGLGLTVLDARGLEGLEVWEAVFAARRQPRLFSKIAGVLSLHDFNIFSAESCVWRDDVVVSVFRVSPPADPLYPEAVWARVRSSVRFALTGKLAVEYRLAEKRASLLGQTPRRRAIVPVQVNVDNSITPFYSVIEVLTLDRLGLLYEIAHTLDSLGVEAHLAKAATAGEQVADYFYCRDIFGQKIEDADHIREIQRALTQRLGQG